MNKVLLTAIFAAVTSMGAPAQTFKEWQNPEVNAVNRAPMRAANFAYDKNEAALKSRDMKASKNYLSLNGLWKFNWVNDADRRPVDFWKKDFNDKGWGEMPVPGIWELNGYGDPLYVNIEYPWSNQFENNPPYVPVANNHVGTYRREIKVPAGWKGCLRR